MYNEKIALFFLFSYLSTSFSQYFSRPGRPSLGYGFPTGPLPFPLFPLPCDMGCSTTGYIFANITINDRVPRPSTGFTTRPPGNTTRQPPGSSGSGSSGGGSSIQATWRPPSGSGGQNVNFNTQYGYFIPQWCTGWCRFLYQPLFFPPPPPPPPPPYYNSDPSQWFFSWFGF